MSAPTNQSADVIARDQARSAAERYARHSTKRMIRTYATATATYRSRPDFLVIGAKRGGTTTFVDQLREHPGVLGLFPAAEKIKGLYYFDEQYSRGERWYRSHFPTDRTRQGHARALGHPVVSGEGSPYYLFHPLAATRAHALVPAAQVLVLLRDPVERAYSHWKERRRNATEPLEFAAALEAESARLAGEESRLARGEIASSFAHRHMSYVSQGNYAPMLERWFETFGRDHVWVAASETVFADPQRALDAVHVRLGLPGHRLVAARRLNAEPSPGLDPGLRRELTARLGPSIRATEALLGQPMPWPR